MYEILEFVVYETQINIDGEKVTRTLRGLQYRVGFLYKYISFNTFEKTEMIIPYDYKKKHMSEEHIKSFYYDLNKIILEKNNTEYEQIKNKMHYDTNSYYTHDNGGRPFLVYIEPYNGFTTPIHIYEINTDKYYVRESDEGNDNKWMYTNLVKTYNAINVWMGNEYNYDHIGTYDEILCVWEHKFAIGNSIIIQTNNLYVFIGDIVREFELAYGDTVEYYYSPVGQNDVPYPVIIGKDNVYFLLGSDFVYIPINEFNPFTKKEQINAYGQFYQSKMHGNKINIINKLRNRKY